MQTFYKNRINKKILVKNFIEANIDFIIKLLMSKINLEILFQKPVLDKPIKIIGYHQFDFEITAPIKLLEIGYYAGFGTKNASGFGFCDVIKI